MGLMSTGRRSQPNGQPPLHECVTGDRCVPTWLATAGPGLTFSSPVPNPAATILLTARVVYQGQVVASPGTYITPAQADLWGVPHG